MRALIQKVSRAEVSVSGQTIGAIGTGLLVFLGVADDDTEEDLSYLLRKIIHLRIFEDENDKMNLSLQDVGGSILAVSQFTLFASTKKGNRPSFTQAGEPEFSRRMYEKFIEGCRKAGVPTECGRFGAHMEVALVNDGPVTIWIDSKNR